jgi:hypothetical protein
MIKFIKRTNLKELENIVSKIDDKIDDKTYAKIKKYISKIEKRDIEEYKYGSSWIDKWFMRLDISKINSLLKPFSIVVV